MKTTNHHIRFVLMAMGAAATFAATTAATDAAPFTFPWQVVVNNGDAIPESGDPPRKYNSYNPPSVNADALVVFRARSTGRPDGPVSGIYTRDMAAFGPITPITKVADRETAVPFPNNTTYPPEDLPATFNEFPAFPRIAITADTVATRGQSQPVWTYILPDGTETRVGTAGIYTNPMGTLVTGASQLGIVPGFEFYAVPGVDTLTRFDQFPGAPSVTQDAAQDVIVFKGNYSVLDLEDPSVTIGKTGVFFRPVTAADAGGGAPVQLVANSDTPIPNPGACPPDTPFGATAPPSAAGDQMVFVGVDNEDDPTCGGIYQAPLRGPLAAPPENLTTLVGLETPYPVLGNQPFSALGEGLSFDGRFVGFWGAWGEQTETRLLFCPQEGNMDRRIYCQSCVDPDDDGFPVEVPVNQGIFVYDTEAGALSMVARAPGRFDDFLYWNFSGAPPADPTDCDGSPVDEREPPRWRASAFVAVSGQDAGPRAFPFQTAFQARTGRLVDGVYIDPVDGIYLATGPGQGIVRPVVETGMDGTILDPEAIDPLTGEILPVASVAMERDAFRGPWLAITASMGTEEAGWAGIYLTRVPAPPGP